MATKIYAHPFNYGTSSDILDFKTHSVRKRMPAWRECADPKPPFVTFGADAWNCAKCEGERPFALPVNTSDILQYQFQFDDSVNEDPANPVYGWQDSSSDDDPYYMKARILNCDCEAVESYNFIDDFSPVYGVAFDAVGGSFQYLQIDVGELPSDLCCFYIQIEHYVMVDDVLVNDQNIVSVCISSNNGIAQKAFTNSASGRPRFSFSFAIESGAYCTAKVVARASAWLFEKRFLT